VNQCVQYLHKVITHQETTTHGKEALTGVTHNELSGRTS
jgi:hypothetical protein